MSEVFVDGIRSVAVANGVARVELVQLRRGADQSKLEPEVVATLLVPAAGLRELAQHLADSVRRIEASARPDGRVSASPGGDVDSALENL